MLGKPNILLTCSNILQVADNNVALEIWETEKAVANIDKRIHALTRPWHEAQSSGSCSSLFRLLLTQRLTRYSLPFGQSNLDRIIIVHTFQPTRQILRGARHQISWTLSAGLWQDGYHAWGCLNLSNTATVSLSFNFAITYSHCCKQLLQPTHNICVPAVLSATVEKTLVTFMTISYVVVTGCVYFFSYVKNN